MDWNDFRRSQARGDGKKTPRSKAADEVGRALRSKRLGTAAEEYFSLYLTESESQKIGEKILDEIEDEDIPDLLDFATDSDDLELLDSELMERRTSYIMEKFEKTQIEAMVEEVTTE